MSGEALRGRWEKDLRNLDNIKQVCETFFNQHWWENSLDQTEKTDRQENVLMCPAGLPEMI